MEWTALVSTRILRYEVPVDDLPHAVALHGDPLAVNSPSERMVEFWAWAPSGSVEPRLRTFMVVGTGQPGAVGVVKHWGTVFPPRRDTWIPRVVWHLVELVHE